MLLVAPEKRVQLWAEPARDIVLSLAGARGTVPGKQSRAACRDAPSLEAPCSPICALGGPTFAEPADKAGLGKAPQLRQHRGSNASGPALGHAAEPGEATPLGRSPGKRRPVFGTPASARSLRARRFRGGEGRSPGENRAFWLFLCVAICCRAMKPVGGRVALRRGAQPAWPGAAGAARAGCATVTLDKGPGACQETARRGDSFPDIFHFCDWVFTMYIT